MIYSVEYAPKARLILTEIHGEIDFNILKDCAKKVLEGAKQIKCPLILTDMWNAELNRSAVEIHMYLKDMREVVSAHGFTIHSLKRAFVTKPNDHTFDFYENVCHNTGHNVKRFYDIGAARDWLLGRKCEDC